MKRFYHLIGKGVHEGYSDIHVSGGHPFVFRKNGKIIFDDTDQYTPGELDALVKKILTPYEMVQLRSRLSVDFARTVEHVRIRVNVFSTTRGMSMAIRLLPGRIPNFSDLNLNPMLKNFCSMSSGLILICGATGSGKSTTIAAMLAEINRNYGRHIITLEDPVEYRFHSNKSYVEQRELATHMPSFDQGLRDVLREDPDVIMVGELREPETIRLTLNAVESGHLVVASLHATHSEDALYRMCNSFPPDAQDMVRTQLSSVLSLLIVQKLEYFERVGFRLPVLSILAGTNSVKAIIRENRFAQIESALQTSRADGMYTMDKYRTDYIGTRSKFTPPSISFKPSPETEKSQVYQSPLLKKEQKMDTYTYREAEQVNKVERKQQQKGSKPVHGIPKSIDRSGRYVIDDDVPMEDILSELNGPKDSFD